MKKKLLRSTLASGLLALSDMTSAAMSTAEAQTNVESMLAQGRAAIEIIEMLVEDGRTLSEATSTAMGAASGDFQLELAKTGICAATDLPEAQKVGTSALTIVPTVLAEDVIRGTVEGYDNGACASYERKTLPPPLLQDRGDTIEGRGTGLPPPVSPAN